MQRRWRRRGVAVLSLSPHRLRPAPTVNATINTNRPAGDRNGGSSEDSVSGDDAVSEKIPRGTSVLLMWRTALLHGVRSSTVHWHYPWESNACRSFLNRTCFGTVGPASHCSIEDRE